MLHDKKKHKDHIRHFAYDSTSDIRSKTIVTAPEKNFYND